VVTTSSSSTAARVATTNDHGTGCSLSAAICAGLGLGRTLPDAARDAKSFVLAALTSAADWKLGRGRGPIETTWVGAKWSDEATRSAATTTTSGPRRRVDLRRRRAAGFHCWSISFPIRA